MAALILTQPEYESSTEEEDTAYSESGASDSGSASCDEENVLHGSSPASTARGYQYQDEAKKRFYPHDFVVLKEKQYPYEWNPTFGVLVEPSHPSLELPEFQATPKISLSKWNPEEGLEDALYVQWGNSPNIKHMKHDDISVVDRIIVKGQKVARQDGTIGLVVDTHVRVSAQIVDTNHVITDVEAKKLKPVTPFVRGIEILYDNKWVGIITHVKRTNTLRMESFTRGKEFVLETTEADGFMRQDPYSTQAINIPGQRTRLTAKQMDRALWKGRVMSTLWRMPLKYMISTPQATYLEIKPVSIIVKWLQAKPTAGNLDQASVSSITLARSHSSTEIPASDFSKIQFVGIPNYETIQLGSVRMYKMNEGDSITSFNSWMSGFRSRFLGEAPPRYANQSYPPGSFAALATQTKNEVPVKILLKQTYTTIEWSNGDVETMPSSAIPVICASRDSPAHRTGAVVASYFDSEAAGVSNYAIVQYSEEQVRARTGTILVKWLQVTELPNGDETIADLGVKEESIYDLRPHPEFTFYRLHTSLFLKKERSDVPSQAGVVLDIDVQNGTMRLGAASTSETFTIYPHEVVPLNQRCYWNFFTRKWEVDVLLPHEHHLVIERKVPVRAKEPIFLANLNNDGARPKFQSCLLEEPQLLISESAPSTHYYHTERLKNLPANFGGTLARDLEALDGNVPSGVWVRTYEDRLDLFSVLFLGPVNTPYEDGLFLFDLQIPADFPTAPPKVHFILYSDPLNPLIASDGAFCVSKLDWEWTLKNCPASYIQNALRQIQGLLFTPEPFYASDLNKQLKDTDLGDQFIRVYNEKVYINVLTSAINMLKHPHDSWREVIGAHFSVALVAKLVLAHKWLKYGGGVGAGASALGGNEETEDTDTEDDPFDDEDRPPAPAYPLLPLSKGFKLALATRLETLDKMLPPDAVSIRAAQTKPTPKARTIILQDTGFQQVRAEPSELPSPLLSPSPSPSTSSTATVTAPAVAASAELNEDEEIVETTEVQAVTASD